MSGGRGASKMLAHLERRQKDWGPGNIRSPNHTFRRVLLMLASKPRGNRQDGRGYNR
jgi:hypothetical protein